MLLDFLVDFLLLWSSDASDIDTLAGTGPEVIVPPVLLSLGGSFCFSFSAQPRLPSFSLLVFERRKVQKAEKRRENPASREMDPFFLQTLLSFFASSEEVVFQC